MQSKSMTITHRAYQSEADYWAVRQLLIDTYPMTPTDFNWEIRRWDGWFHHNAEPRTLEELAARIHLWEADGQVVGAVHPEYPGNFCLEMHPGYRHLIEEPMIAWAEEHLTAPSDDGTQHRLHTFVFEYNVRCKLLLEKRGYKKQTWGEVMRRLRLPYQPIPPVTLAAGYTLRTTEPCLEDAQCIADILNAAFNRDIHAGKELFNFMQHSPSFRHDLDLAAVAPDGTFAAYVSVTYDEVNKRGIFEPVCTHPDHQRKGLARALINEGLHRLVALGAADAYVGTGDQIPANLLYDALGFTEVYQSYGWEKVLD